MKSIFDTIIFEDNNLEIPDQLRGKIKTVGYIHDKPIKYGDVNMLRQGDLYYINSVKQVYRFIKEYKETQSSSPGGNRNTSAKSSGANVREFVFSPIVYKEIVENTQEENPKGTKSMDDQTTFFVIPEEQLGTKHRVGYLFKHIIYGGDVNLVPNDGLYYNEIIR